MRRERSAGTRNLDMQVLFVVGESGPFVDVRSGMAMEAPPTTSIRGMHSSESGVKRTAILLVSPSRHAAR
jgi:hypothetical protein